MPSEIVPIARKSRPTAKAHAGTPGQLGHTEVRARYFEGSASVRRVVDDVFADVGSEIELDDSTPEAVSLLLRFENRMSSAFVAVGACIHIDEQSVWQDAATVTADFAAHKPMEVRVLLRPGVPHQLRVAVAFVGRGPAAGYTFSVESPRVIGPADLEAGILLGEFVERGTSKTPIQQRPTVEWTTPTAVHPAS